MNVLVVIQITVYILALVLALCISVPVIIHQKDFKYTWIKFTKFGLDLKEIFFLLNRGHCLLFSRGTWRETDGWKFRKIFLKKFINNDLFSFE